MKFGGEDRKKLILASSLGAVALGTLIYQVAGSGDSTAPAAPAPPAARVATPSPVATAHVSRAALDPTLHPDGMLAAEALVYTGSGRNIFSGSSEPSTIAIPRVIAPVRTQPVAQIVPSGPPPLPPIELRFFGTAQIEGGKRQAFFLKGDDVFVASEGDVVGRRYRVGAIGTGSVQVTDLTNNNTQSLPMVMQ